MIEKETAMNYKLNMDRIDGTEILASEEEIKATARVDVERASILYSESNDCGEEPPSARYTI